MNLSKCVEVLILGLFPPNFSELSPVSYFERRLNPLMEPVIEGSYFYWVKIICVLVLSVPYPFLQVTPIYRLTTGCPQTIL